MWGFRKPKAITKYTDLQTWDKHGIEVMEEVQLKEEKPVFPVNTEINKKVSVWFHGDSSALKCDAVVNAANSKLAAGGGICGILHSAAGPELQVACNKIGYTETGEAALTPGFKLPAKYVIHAVGPRGEHPEALKKAYNSTLKYIDGDKIKSIGFCCISTGIFGYPIENATHVALRTCREFLENKENFDNTDRLIFVVFEPRDCEVYKRLLQVYFPLEKQEEEKKEEEKVEEEKKEEEKVEE